MNALGQQMALARGGQGNGQRLALAQACDASACDATSPFSVWASGLGGLGWVQGDGNASTLSYNFGGAAAGIDYRFNPRFLAGIGVGYIHGTQWVTASWAAAGAMPRAWRPTAATRKAPSMPMRWRATPIQQPAAAPDLDLRPVAAHRQRQHRRQPVPGPGRAGLQGAVYAPAAATLTPFARMRDLER